jgi:hypothetical protein
MITDTDAVDFVADCVHDARGIAARDVETGVAIVGMSPGVELIYRRPLGRPHARVVDTGGHDGQQYLVVTEGRRIDELMSYRGRRIAVPIAGDDLGVHSERHDAKGRQAAHGVLIGAVRHAAAWCYRGNRHLSRSSDALGVDTARRCGERRQDDTVGPFSTVTVFVGAEPFHRRGVDDS